MLHLTRMTPLATAASSLPSVQELQAFQVGQNVSAEFRTFAEEGDLSELLVRVLPSSITRIIATVVFVFLVFGECFYILCMKNSIGTAFFIFSSAFPPKQS